MSKTLIVSLISIVLVLVIVVGAVNALASSEDGNITIGDVVDGVGDAIGNSTTSPGQTTAAPETDADPDGSGNTPVNEAAITYLKNGSWVELDYDVGYEPEYTSDNEFSGYIVYVKFKVPVAYKKYNIAFDCTGLTASQVDRCTLYWDIYSNSWKNTIVSTTSYTEDNNGNGVLDDGEDENGNGVLDSGTVSLAKATLSGAFNVTSGEEGYIRFCPLYNLGTAQFNTATAAAEFAQTLKDGNFVLQITDAVSDPFDSGAAG